MKRIIICLVFITASLLECACSWLKREPTLYATYEYTIDGETVRQPVYVPYHFPLSMDEHEPIVSADISMGSDSLARFGLTLQAMYTELHCNIHLMVRSDTCVFFEGKPYFMAPCDSTAFYEVPFQEPVYGPRVKCFFVCSRCEIRDEFNCYDPNCYVFVKDSSWLSFTRQSTDSELTVNFNLTTKKNNDSGDTLKVTGFLELLKPAISNQSYLNRIRKEYNEE